MAETENTGSGRKPDQQVPGSKGSPMTEHPTDAKLCEVPFCAVFGCQSGAPHCTGIRAARTTPIDEGLVKKLRDAAERGLEWAIDAANESKGEGDPVFINAMNDIRRIEAALEAKASLPTPVIEELWQPSERAPCVDSGSGSHFIVTVRRAHGSKDHYTFPAMFLNGAILNFEDEPYERETTGWFSAETDGDDGTNYSPLLSQGDELLGWCELPVWDARETLGPPNVS